MATSYNLPDHSFAQELDETRQHRAPVKAQIVWDNITDSGQFLCGIEPDYSMRHRKSVAALKGGSFVEFFVPSHELVRVVSCNTKILDQVEIWTSNGSGIYRKQKAAVSQDGYSMVAAPNQSGTSIARVWRPAHLAGEICIAAFTSRRKTPQLLDYYQCPIEQSGAKVEIQSGLAARDYKFVPADQSRRLQTRGPKRLRIETRLKYNSDIQRNQPYWVRVFCDGVLKQVLSFNTLSPRNERVFVDDCERMVGRREFAYVDLDAGERNVEIKTSHDVYVRVDGIGLDLCRPNLNRSFDFPSWQKVQKSLSVWDASHLDPGSSVLSETFLHDGRLPTIMRAAGGDQIWNPYLNQQRIAKLSRDNSIPHSGLRAYMWMRAIATNHMGDADYGDEISVPDLAERLRINTRFVDMVPIDLPSDSEARTVTFSNQRPRSPKLHAAEVILGEQHLPNAIAAMPTATVYRLPYQNGAKLRYRVPDSVGTTMIRVVVDQTHLNQKSVVMVRYDDREPIELTVAPQDVLKNDCFAPGTTDAALSGLAAIHPLYNSGTAGGPFSMWKDPVPMVRAATCEFAKPADVKNIEVWLASSKHPSVRIGLQYMDSRKSELPESAFRALNAIAFNEGIDPESSRFASQEIRNDSIGVERWLRTQHDAFVISVQPSDDMAPPTEIWDAARLATMHRDATFAAKADQLATAIGMWSQIIRHSQGVTRRNAILSRINALQLADEDLLADRERRGWLRYSEDPELRIAVYEQLLETVKDNDAQTGMILGFAAIENPHGQYETRLARHFMQAGRYRYALLVLSSFEPTEETQDILLRCSFHVQWWTLFDNTLWKIQDLDTRNLWLGLKQLRLGHYRQAKPLLQSAGEKGVKWLSHWERGDAIFKRLKHRDHSVRLRAIGDWENWQADHPGHHFWVEEPSVIKSCSGTATIFLEKRDVRIRRHKLDSGQTAKLAVHGPVKARIEIRPIHDSTTSDPKDEWIYITSNGNVQRVPLIANAPSRTLSIEQASGQPASHEHPGERVFVEVDLPAGFNQFGIRSQNSALLLAVAVQRPDMTLPVLPHVNETTMAAIVKGSFGNQKHRCNISQKGDVSSANQDQCKDCLRLVYRNGECRSIPRSFVCEPCGCNEIHAAKHYLDQINTVDADVWRNRVVPTEQPIQIVDRDSLFEHALDAYAVGLNGENGNQISRVLAIVQLQQLANDYPQRDDISKLLNRLMSGTRWESFQQIDSRAGVHSLDIDGWVPESLGARIRKAYTASPSSPFVLTGDKQISLMTNNDQPTEFEVILRAPRMGFLPRGETTVVMERRARSELISIAPDQQSAVVRVQLPAGPQSLQINQGTPAANQYLYVDVNEILPDGSIVPIQESKIKLKSRSRTYQVATVDEPLQFRVAGPTLLRIDRNHDGRVTQEIIAVEHDRSFSLSPRGNRTSSLIRVFELSLNGSRIPSYQPELIQAEPTNKWADSVVQTLYEQVDNAGEPNTLHAIGLRSPDLEPFPLRLNDYGDLGLQELGTWSAQAGFRQRDAIEEFIQDENTERTFDFSLTRHYYDQWRDLYHSNQALFRPRLNGGPTLGFVHEGEKYRDLNTCEQGSCRERWGDVRFNWRGYFYSQFADQPIPVGNSSVPWSAGFNASVTRPHTLTSSWRHSPTLTFFGRTLSEDSSGFEPGELDQDVFTSFKSDHRYGLRISDRFVYQSCLDRRWWIRPSLMTNPDEITPDNLGLQLGTDQLLGPVQLRLSYRATSFLSDNDREESSTQNIVALDVALESWQSRTRRNQISFSLRNELASGRSTIGFNFASFLNHSRGYRDIRPSTQLFGPIREERAAKHYSIQQR